MYQNCIANIEQRAVKLVIRKNSFGNFEHPTYHFVFDQTGKVYGRQDGREVKPLRAQDVADCIKENFKVGKPKLFIQKNSYGNYEGLHNILFNAEGKVWARQQGALAVPLTKKDVEICKRHNFQVDDQWRSQNLMTDLSEMFLCATQFNQPVWRGKVLKR